MNTRTIGLVAGGAVIIVMTSSAFAQTQSFGRALRLGASGEDVRLLQQLLNRDARTQIAATGPGSPGNETALFGPLTRSAVIRFQELHNSEVLLPAGLTRGTGIVGAFTVAKLNALLQQPPAASGPVLVSITPWKTEVRGSISVTGIGFDEAPITAAIGGIAVPATVSADKATVSLWVPSELGPGLHPVVITNARGKSNELKIRVENAASQSAAASFGISQLSPSRGGYGTTVTILGNGFAPTGNTVTFGFATFTNVPSVDGRTITLQIPNQFAGLTFTPAQLGGTKPEVPLGVMVTNSSGETNVAVFTFTFYN